jgi:hypothetical protein
LCQLRAKITRCLKAIGPHYRKCDDVAHSCVACRFQQVGCSAAEESESGRILERGGIADIDHDGGIRQRLCQAGAGQRVNTGARRSGDDLMALGPQQSDEGPTDQPGAADDNDLHVRVSDASVCLHDEMTTTGVTWDGSGSEKYLRHDVTLRRPVSSSQRAPSSARVTRRAA